MNPTPCQPTPVPRPRIALPPPAFHSFRALVPRGSMRYTRTLALPAPPSQETRAFPIELSYIT